MGSNEGGSLLGTEAGLSHRWRNSYLHHEENVMSRTMYIMSGCQGSGKSTWASRKTGAIVVSADSYFVNEKGEYHFSFEGLGKAHAECFHNAILTVQANQDCIVDNTNSTALEIAPYYQLAKAYGYDVVIVKVSCDPTKAAARNVHNVPEAGVKATASRCANLSLPPFWDVEVQEVKT
jgi:predicted kinase